MAEVKPKSSHQLSTSGPLGKRTLRELLFDTRHSPVSARCAVVNLERNANFSTSHFTRNSSLSSTTTTPSVTNKDRINITSRAELVERVTGPSKQGSMKRQIDRKDTERELEESKQQFKLDT